MIGYYNLLEDGKIVAQSRNVITEEGARVILRYLAGMTPAIAGAIAVGTSDVAAAATDTRLGFEFGRGPVNLSAPDFLTNKVLWKATLPTGIAGEIRELGLYPAMTGPAAGYDSRLITAFESSYEPLTGGSAVTTNTRVGGESYGRTGAGTITLTATQGDFSGFSNSDEFSLAYYAADANTDTITVRFYTDPANYFTYVVTGPNAAGYTVQNFAKSAVARVGVPDWSNITSIAFISAGAGTFSLDGFRINDTDPYIDYALVSRSTLTTPYAKVLTRELDIEYVIGFDL